MRTFTITRDMDPQALRRALVDQRISAARADAAFARIRALNPHVELDRARPGIIIFVPDGPEFTARTADTPVQGAADEFRALAAAALAGAAEELKAALSAREADRTDVRAALDSDAFRSAIANDRDLLQRAEEAESAMKAEEEADATAAERLDATGTAALETLADLGKLAG